MVTLWQLFWFFVLVPLGLFRDGILLTCSMPLFIFPGLLIVSHRLLFAKPTDEFYLLDCRNVLSVFKQVVLFLLSVSPFWWMFWGMRFVILTVINLGRLLTLQWHIWPAHWRISYQGNPHLPCTYRVYFVNGICVDKHWLQLNCETLEEHLKHQVNGIYNQTNGFFIDLIECFLQRNINFYTGSVLNAAAAVEADLRSGNKVMLIGHSQGGIIVSLVVDHLMNYYPSLVTTTNLEVYTFASAADEFMAPAIPIVVKHYANMFDVVACLGVLGCYLTCCVLGATIGPSYGIYYGHIFVNPCTFGHLLSTFYVFQHPSVYIPVTYGTTPAPF